MLLVIRRRGLESTNNILSVWDTDDMVIEDIDRNLFWEYIHAERIEVGNVIYDSLVDGERHYSIQSEFVFPLYSPLTLGCGDIWYNKYVWNAISGKMYEVSIFISSILVGNGMYSFMYGDKSVYYKDATFVYDKSVSVTDKVLGKQGVAMSRETFMKKVVLGLLE